METLSKIRKLVVYFITLLILSGLTAFPVRTELKLLMSHLNSFPFFLQEWIVRLNTCIDSTPDVMLYGTDWLAFAHIVIALFFIPVFIDPVRYKANITAGMVACIAVFPLAFICGQIRSIPIFHRLIDCSFGLGGFLLLYQIYRLTIRLSKNLKTNEI